MGRVVAYAIGLISALHQRATQPRHRKHGRISRAEMRCLLEHWELAENAACSFYRMAYASGACDFAWCPAEVSYIAVHNAAGRTREA